MVSMRGFWNGTLYKLLGSTINNGCNSSVVLEKTNKEDKTNIEDHVVASKTGTYWRKGPLDTTQKRYGRRYD